MKTLIILLGLALQFYCSNAHESNQVWRVAISAERRHDVEAMVEQYTLDVWSDHVDNFDILITPEVSSVVEKHLQELGLSYHVMIENIQSIIEEQEVLRRNRKEIQPTAVIDLEVYHDLDEIYAYMDELAVEFDYITIETIGQSVEGRDLKMLKLSTQADNQNAFWIQCGIHAREWVTPATCIYGLDLLTQNYGTDAEITAFLDAQDVYMVVSVNPDGYAYTWTGSANRLWRKNRRINNGSECLGIDLNRNYDDGFSWGGEGSSPNPCSGTYHGSSGFSEPETASLSNKIIEIQQTQNIGTFYDVHSYGQLWLFPYGYTLTPPANFNEVNATSVAAVNAIFDIFGTQYTFGSFGIILYIGSGTSIDWAYATGIEYCYTPELRDTGTFGFLLPEDQIVPTATEFWAGLFAAYDTQAK